MGVGRRRVTVAERSSKFVVGHNQIALPDDVARVLAGQVFGNGQSVAEGGQRGGGITLGAQGVTDIDVACRQTALPSGIARVLAGQVFVNGQGLTEGGQRSGGIALVEQGVTDLVVAYRQIALPGGVAPVLVGQALSYCEGLAVRDLDDLSAALCSGF